MAKLGVKRIQDEAVRVVASHADGIRYSDLVRAIVERYPETPKNTVHGAVWNLAVVRPEEITKPARGLFRTRGRAEATAAKPLAVDPKAREEDFYGSFAEFLRDELDEVSTSRALGGAALKTKWGTPDGLGVYKPMTRDLLKFAPEIVAVEIKIDPNQPVVAFGQSVAYRLFAAKTYLVLPRSIGAEDQSRVEALCMLFGIGLILFDVKPNEPAYEIRMRAQRFQPDMFYVNEFAERLKAALPDVFDELFD